MKHSYALIKQIKKTNKKSFCNKRSYLSTI